MKVIKYYIGIIALSSCSYAIAESDYSYGNKVKEIDIKSQMDSLLNDPMFIQSLKPNNDAFVPPGDIYQVDDQTYIEQTGSSIKNNIDGNDKTCEEQTGNSNEKGCGNENRPGQFVFISESIPEGTLKDIISLASGNADVTLVTRGIAKGASFTTNTKMWAKYLDTSKSPPNLIMDPKLFKKYSITKVPVMIIKKDDKVAQVGGRSNTLWFSEYVIENGYKDYGLMGSTYDILKIYKIDFQKLISKKKKKA
jgi:type-F conjugative transfer system pilin assembly protein TrbC